MSTSLTLTYKYRIKDKSARKALRQHAWAVNQVWNWCVAQHRDAADRYRAGALKRRWPTHFDLAKSCNGVGAELGILQQSVGAVCKQFTQNRNICRRSPRFRASNGPRRALGWIPFHKQSRRICGNSITYGGKCFRFWEGGRPIPSTAKAGAFVEDARGRWYVCIQVEVSAVRSAAIGAVGIDLGLKALATCSDGSVVEAPHIYRKYEQRLAVAQRAGNKRRTRAIYAKIKECRRDFIHKATTKIARANALIAVGDVQGSNLLKTAMAKSILDAGWSTFRQQLRYKASRHGAEYLDVDESFTTRTCSSCGAIPDSSPKGIGALGIREWECSECGASHNRDVNAAKNILALALSAQRPTEESGRAIRCEMPAR